MVYKILVQYLFDVNEINFRPAQNLIPHKIKCILTFNETLPFHS